MRRFYFWISDISVFPRPDCNAVMFRSKNFAQLACSASTQHRAILLFSAFICPRNGALEKLACGLECRWFEFGAWLNRNCSTGRLTRVRESEITFELRRRLRSAGFCNLNDERHSSGGEVMDWWQWSWMGVVEGLWLVKALTLFVTYWVEMTRCVTVYSRNCKQFKHSVIQSKITPM